MLGIRGAGGKPHRVYSFICAEEWVFFLMCAGIRFLSPFSSPSDMSLTPSVIRVPAPQKRGK